MGLEEVKEALETLSKFSPPSQRSPRPALRTAQASLASSDLSNEAGLTLATVCMEVLKQYPGGTWREAAGGKPPQSVSSQASPAGVVIKQL